MTGHGQDEVPVKVLIECREVISPVQCDIVNLSFERGKFPDCMELAIVIPLYKSGDIKLPANFRPISILPSMSQIFERCMHNRLSRFISE